MKDENATGLGVEAILKEILQRVKEDGFMVEATTKEILQRTKEEEVIRELPVMK